MSSRSSKSYLLILLTFFIPKLTFSQNSISTISSSASCHGSCSILSPNGEYFVGGTKDYMSFISKFDASNNIIWSKELTTSYGGQSRSTITTFRLHGDTIIGVGQSEGSAIANTDGAFVFKMNASNGSLYWFKGEITSNMYFSDVMIDGNNYIIAGAANNGSANNNSNFLAISASSGNIVWQTNQFDLTFASTNYHHIDDILATTEVHDGYFYATGRLYLNGGNEMRAFVQKLSSTGQLIWSKYLLFPENSGASVRFYGRDIEYIEAEDNIVVGVAGDPSGVSTDWRIGLIKIDTSGAVLWAKQYNHPSSSEDLRYVEVIDNGFRVVGQTNQYSPTGKNIVVFETNFNGNLTISKEIEKAGFNCLILHPDFNNLPGETSHIGNQTITSFSIRNTSGAPQLNQLVILKVNDLNQLNSSCFTVTTPILTETSLAPFSDHLPHTVTPLNSNFNLVAASNNTTFTNSCAGESHQISVNISSCQTASLNSNTSAPYQVLWSTGANSSQITVNVSGDYWVEIFNPTTCCYYYDTVSVTVEPGGEPEGILPPFLDTCNTSGGSIPIEFIQSSPSNILWNTGESTSTIFVTQSGTYSVTASNSCGSNTYTIDVQIDENEPFFTMPPEDVLCVDQNFSYPISPILNGANPNEYNFLWSTGQFTPSISVNQSGMYSLTMSNECGTYTDSVEYLFNIKPSANFQATSTQGCDSIQVTFSNLSQNANTYLWDFGNGNTFNVSSTDPIIQNFNNSVEVQLIAENLACKDTMVLQIEINICGCTDPLALNFDPSSNFDNGTCEYLELIFFIPNAFTPDDDEYNPTFIPVFTEGFDNYDYVLYIYNRWGELIFESHDASIGWDGTYKGVLAQEGIYTWKVEFKTLQNDERKTKVGHLSLLR